MDLLLHFLNMLGSWTEKGCIMKFFHCFLRYKTQFHQWVFPFIILSILHQFKKWEGFPYYQHPFQWKTGIKTSNTAAILYKSYAETWKRDIFGLDDKGVGGTLEFCTSFLRFIFFVDTINLLTSVFYTTSTVRVL